MDVVELLSSVPMDPVDSSFICSIEESVECSGRSERDLTVDEVGRNDVSSNKSVDVVVVNISIVVPLVDMGCDEDDNDCSVELEIMLVVPVSISEKNVLLV